MKIFTEEGEAVTSINMQFPISFNSPYLIFDILRDKQKEPLIKTSDNLEILKDIDFILYAKPISKKDAWAKRQKYIIYLRHEDAPIDADFKQLKKLPANHFFEVDISNFKIRVVGPFVKGDSWLDY